MIVCNFSVNYVSFLSLEKYILAVCGMTKYYLLGVGGIAMSSLAGLLKQKGHKVSGSDSGVFGPSLAILKKLRIPYADGYDANNIKKFKPDLVIIGNGISRGNIELEYVLNERILFSSLPDIFHKEFVRNKKAIVITGTSGKTTTTALISWILEALKMHPTTLVGGLTMGKNELPLYGQGNYVVVEGDEYNSSFFDIGPKFLHYQPFIGIINNIEHDHVDIYAQLSDVKRVFNKFVSLVPQQGLLIVNRGNPNAMEASRNARSSVQSFGKNGDIIARNISFSTDGLVFDTYFHGQKLGQIKSQLFGHHNVENILATLLVTRALKLPFSQVAKAIENFPGIKRRLETIYVNGQIKIIDDFGHNPQKVAASVSAIRKHNLHSRLIAVFEPRTASSRRKVFQSTYAECFRGADLVYLSQPFNKKALKADELFSSEKLARDLNKKNIQAHVLENADQIVAHLIALLLKKKANQTIILVMSSGSFDGIHQKLKSKLTSG